jgi:hypothetical protein
MRSIAICCGFNNYGGPDLRRAENDATHLYAKLTRSKAFNSAPDLIGQGALFTQRTSAEAILSALDRAMQSSAELVWFSFSGHATLSAAGELVLLLPEWHWEHDAEHRRQFSIGAHDLDRVLTSRRPAKNLILIIDTCYSGAYRDDVAARDIKVPIGGRLTSAGTVAICACSKDQLADDGNPASGELNGTFSKAVISVLDDHISAGTTLSALSLFFTAKGKVANGQTPILHVNALLDDFLVLTESTAILPRPLDGIVHFSAEVPTKIKNELTKFLKSVVQISRSRRVGLVHAERQLEGLAAEFYKYGQETFIVPDFNANVTEAYDKARTCIIACTTPAYFEAWHHSGGDGLLNANRVFILQHKGRVTRFFFVRGGFRDSDPGILNVIRDHVKVGIRVFVVDVDSYGPVVLREVFDEPRPDDLSSLEFAFVDGHIFLKTHFTAKSDLKIEVDQRQTRCQNEYKAQLRPFLDTRDARPLEARLKPGNDDEVLLEPLGDEEMRWLRAQIEKDLGLPEVDPVTPRPILVYRPAARAKTAPGSVGCPGAGRPTATSEEPVHREAEEVEGERRRR